MHLPAAFRILYLPTELRRKLRRSAFSRLLRREADERLSPSLQGSAIHAFLPSRSAPGRERVGRRSPRRSLLGVALSRPILGCPLLSTPRLSPRLRRRSVRLVSLS